MGSEAAHNICTMLLMHVLLQLLPLLHAEVMVEVEGLVEDLLLPARPANPAPLASNGVELEVEAVVGDLEVF